MRSQSDLNSLRWIQYPPALRFNPATPFIMPGLQITNRCPPHTRLTTFFHKLRQLLSASSVILRSPLQMLHLKGAPNASYSTA